MPASPPPGRPSGPFDPEARARALDRARRLAAARGAGGAAGGAVEETRLFRLAEVAAGRLVERVFDMRRDFPRVLEFGGHRSLSSVRASLAPRAGLGGLVRLEPLAGAEGAPAEGAADDGAPAEAPAPGPPPPFAGGGFDLVLSHLELHRRNRLPHLLARLRESLAPGGLLLASLAGPSTLAELRAALLRAESEALGGAAPRVDPFPDVRDLGNLLAAAGFAEPVLDRDVLTGRWPSLEALLHDLRAEGAVNALAARSRSLAPKSLFRRAEALMRSPEGGVRVSFEAIFASAWRPGPGPAPNGGGA